MACRGGKRRRGLPYSGSRSWNRVSGSRDPGPDFSSNLHVPGNYWAPWLSRRQSMQLRGGARKNIDERRKRRPRTRELGKRIRRRYARRRYQTRRGHGRRGWNAHGRRAGKSIGPGVPQYHGHHCGRGSGYRCRRNLGICRGRGHCRLAFLRHPCPLGARSIPAEVATPAIYLRSSDRHRDPPDMARGVPGAHQGGRPGSAL